VLIEDAGSGTQLIQDLRVERIYPRKVKPEGHKEMRMATQTAVLEAKRGHCQSKFVYFAKTPEPNFAPIDLPAFFRVDLSGSMAAPSIWNFALTTPLKFFGIGQSPKLKDVIDSLNTINVDLDLMDHAIAYEAIIDPTLTDGLFAGKTRYLDPRYPPQSDLNQ
jgi:hypothetical protein